MDNITDVKGRDDKTAKAMCDGKQASDTMRQRILPLLLTGKETIDLTNITDPDIPPGLAGTKQALARIQPDHRKQTSVPLVKEKHTCHAAGKRPLGAHLCATAIERAKKQNGNLELAKNMAVALHIGTRIPQFPKKVTNNISALNLTKPPLVPVSQSPHCSNRNNNGNDPLPSNLNRHFAEHQPEASMLGAIFVNNLLQQSIADYQKIRSSPYSFHAAQYRNEMVSHTPRVIHSSSAIPVAHVRNLCHSHQRHESTNSTGHWGGSAITQSVTSTFTAPSVSSVLATSLSNSRNVSKEKKKQDVSHHISSAYHTVEMQQSDSAVSANKVSKKPIAIKQRRLASNSRISKQGKNIEENSRESSGHQVSSCAALSTEQTNHAPASTPQPHVSLVKLPDVVANEAGQPETVLSKCYIITSQSTTKTTNARSMDSQSTTKATNAKSMDSQSTTKVTNTRSMDSQSTTKATNVRSIDSQSTTKATNARSMNSQSTNKITNARSIDSQSTSKATNVESMDSQSTKANDVICIDAVSDQQHGQAVKRKCPKRVVTFAEETDEEKEAKQHKSQNLLKNVNLLRRQRIGYPKRNVRSAYRSIASRKFSLPENHHFRIGAVPASHHQISGEHYLLPLLSRLPVASIMAAPMQAATSVTLAMQHNCRFYRCQSVKRDTAMLGLVRSCRMCQSNYSIECENISSGACTINLNNIECPKCWNANACYCGRAFSDRYVKGRDQ